MMVNILCMKHKVSQCWCGICIRKEKSVSKTSAKFFTFKKSHLQLIRLIGKSVTNGNDDLLQLLYVVVFLTGSPSSFNYPIKEETTAAVTPYETSINYDVTTDGIECLELVGNTSYQISVRYNSSCFENRSKYQELICLKYL